MRTSATLLFHPLFVLSLIALICNDFCWKYQYHNWLTGKLSDFAGLIVLPLFMQAIFPRMSRMGILFFSAIFFIWWKSPFSQPAIEALNALYDWPIKRVVDYSDLLALSVLPLGYSVQPRAMHLPAVMQSCLHYLLGVIAFISLCSTSVYRPLFMAHPISRDIYFHETFTRKQSAASVLQTLTNKGIDYRLDSVMYYPVLNQQNLYYRKQASDSAVVWQPVSQVPDSTLYIKREGLPYYLIPAYKATGEEQEILFRNIRFRLSETKKGTKTSITIETFESPDVGSYALTEKNTRRTYKEVLRKLFADE